MMTRPGRVMGGVVTLLVLLCAGCQDRSVKVEASRPAVVRETVGQGRPAEAGDTVTVDYRIETPQGERILAHRDYQFRLGSSSVIAGVEEAVTGMRRGGMREVVCPPRYHWGSQGYGDGAVPPNTNLVIHVKLRDLKRG